MNYESMSQTIKDAINYCQLSTKSLLKICEKTFPNEGCFMATQFVATKNCPPGYVAQSYGYCIPECP